MSLISWIGSYQVVWTVVVLVNCAVWRAGPVRDLHSVLFLGFLKVPGLINLLYSINFPSMKAVFRMHSFIMSFFPSSLHYSFCIIDNWIWKRFLMKHVTVCNVVVLSLKYIGLCWCRPEPSLLPGIHRKISSSQFEVCQVLSKNVRK